MDLSDAEILAADHNAFIKLANDLRLSMQIKPSQSKFRVVCILGEFMLIYSHPVLSLI